jgi:ubiquitin-conjugating enzyme E2 variant
MAAPVEARAFEGGYTISHRIYDCAGLVVGTAAAFALAWRIAHGPGVSAPLAVAALGVGMMGADLVSGFFHWIFDTWGSMTTAVIGPLAIRTFREHHADPASVLAHDFIETSGHNCALSAIASAVGLLSSTTFSACTLLVVALFVAFTNQIHKWAHAPRPPRIVRVLQKSRLILRPSHHREHHDGRHTRNYCITTGWLDAPLRVLRVWPALEAVIEWTTGAKPRGSTG